MAKKQEVSVKHVMGVPDKPTKNGHYMGRNYEFDFEDGKYRIAPCVYQQMDEIIEIDNGLQAFMRAQNAYFGEQFQRLARRKAEWWQKTQEEYGLEGEHLSYSEGWLTPVPVEKSSTPVPCMFCGKIYTAGQEAIDHRLACEKDPFAIALRNPR